MPFYLLQCVFISLPDLETTTVASYSVTFVNFVRIAIKHMRGRPIILFQFIDFFYLLQTNIISLTSLKITLALLFITSFCKNETIFFTLKKWSGQNRTSQTGSYAFDLYLWLVCIYLHCTLCSYTCNFCYV